MTWRILNDAVFLDTWRLSFHHCRVPFLENSSSIFVTWAPCTVRGWWCQRFLFAAVLLFCAGSFHWNEPISDIHFSLGLHCPTDLCGFHSGLFSWNIFEVDAWTSGTRDVLRWFLGSFWMLLVEQAALHTAEPPEIFIRPGQQMDWSSTAVTVLQTGTRGPGSPGLAVSGLAVSAAMERLLQQLPWWS